MAFSDSQDGPSQLTLHGSLVFTSLQDSVEVFVLSTNLLQGRNAKSRWSGGSSAPSGGRVFSLSPASHSSAARPSSSPPSCLQTPSAGLYALFCSADALRRAKFSRLRSCHGLVRLCTVFPNITDRSLHVLVFRKHRPSDLGTVSVQFRTSQTAARTWE